MKRYGLLVGFFATLLILALAIFLLPDREFSENENRYLTQKPTLSWESIKNGSFQSDFSDYISDQIPLREFGIRLTTGIRKLFGHRSIGGVYLGEDDYYFSVFTQDSYSVSHANAICELLRRLSDAQSIPLTVMPVPSPGTVLKDLLPGNAPYYDADKIYNLMQTYLPNVFLDVRSVLCQQAQKSQVYYRTDHHWTADGAYAAYSAYCKKLGIPVREKAFFQVQQVSDSFYGTLYSKTLDAGAKPDSIYLPTNLPELTVTYEGKNTADSLYSYEKLETKDQYTVFFGGNYNLVEIETQVKNGKHLLIIKDSFANAFVPYLCHDFESITMVDLRYYDGDLAKLIADSNTTDLLVLYELSNLLTDKGIIKLGKFFL